MDTIKTDLPSAVSTDSNSSLPTKKANHELGSWLADDLQ
ncbi:hypothetical protein M2109_004565 [Paenibacillus sp. PastH-3]|nr:hypothetical protein [Paenibacillus sp. PastH-4]MDH6446302.1 hypothetical protein [Paenibacillus sp. PastF-4]MDH6530230.1 hypothetical protein [Paenibacillus sp. PastH-3]